MLDGRRVLAAVAIIRCEVLRVPCLLGTRLAYEGRSLARVVVSVEHMSSGCDVSINRDLV